MPPAPTNTAYDNLVKRFKDYSLLKSCEGILGWDERTYMPPAGAGLRADQMALLARLAHETLTSKKTGQMLDEVEASPLVKPATSPAAVNVREIRRLYDRAVKVPKSLVEELSRTTTLAQQAWQAARKADDFPAFLPWLEKIVRLKRQEAAAVGGDGSPYDALLDEYEPGATSKEITQVFATLRTELTPLIRQIAASRKRPRVDVLHRDFPVDRQKWFAESAAAAIGFDFSAGRLDTTTHPFCMGAGPRDVRLTTRYNPTFFNEAFFGTLHEAGHGLYEQGLDPAHAGTPMGSPTSLGIHESQSRTWENQVGRGRPFWEHFFPRARQTFSDTLRDVTLDDWLFAINDVRPSLIRVEADEATYNLHIILRFELEQALINGDLNAAEVPGAWNELFETSLGLKVPDNRHGCLQDVHWSGGGIGYFPTYTLGNLFAAQFMDKAREDLPGLDDDFRIGEFSRFKDWLNTKIHRQGQKYRAAELCRRVTGRALSHQPLLKYLRGKFAPLYGL